MPTAVDGQRFPSKREAERYRQLLLLAKADRIRGLELQVRYELKVRGRKVCEYRADFVYEEYENRIWARVVEDCKGFRTPEYKLKKKLMKACLDIDLRET